MSAPTIAERQAAVRRRIALTGSARTTDDADCSACHGTGEGPFDTPCSYCAGGRPLPAPAPYRAAWENV